MDGQVAYRQTELIMFLALRSLVRSFHLSFILVLSGPPSNKASKTQTVKCICICTHGEQGDYNKLSNCTPLPPQIYAAAAHWPLGLPTGHKLPHWRHVGFVKGHWAHEQPNKIRIRFPTLSPTQLCAVSNSTTIQLAPHPLSDEPSHNRCVTPVTPNATLAASA